MDRVNDFELLRQIRRLGLDAGGSVPVIPMTALAGRELHTRLHPKE
jgi:hypothetical protein